jgi:membrane protease YdiL (CAAX protease family)
VKPRPLSYAGALAWSAAVFGVWIGGLRFFQALTGRAPDLVSRLGWQSAVELLACFGVLAVHGRGRATQAALALRPSHPALPLVALGLGLALRLPVESLGMLIERSRPSSELELVRRAMLYDSDTRLASVLLVLVGTGLAPFAAELLFRGAIFGALRRAHAALITALVTALCFVLSRPEPRRLLELVLLALFLSHMRLASGSLLPCLTLHVGFAATGIAGQLLGVSSVTNPLEPSAALTIFGFAATAGLAALVQYVARHSPEAERARAEDDED